MYPNLKSPINAKPHYPIKEVWVTFSASRNNNSLPTTFQSQYQSISIFFAINSIYFEQFWTSEITEPFQNTSVTAVQSNKSKQTQHNHNFPQQ